MAFKGDVKPGQFFEVSIPKYGEAPISVSGIGDGYIDLTIRKVGRVTNEVFERYKGQSLLLRGPYGNGFDVELYRNGEVVVVAGGTGVSPVRGVIQALSQMPDATDKYVIAGFKSPADMLFKDDLKEWEKKLLSNSLTKALLKILSKSMIYHNIAMKFCGCGSCSTALCRERPRWTRSSGWPTSSETAIGRSGVSIVRCSLGSNKA